VTVAVVSSRAANLRLSRDGFVAVRDGGVLFVLSQPLIHRRYAQGCAYGSAHRKRADDADDDEANAPLPEEAHVRSISRDPAPGIRTSESRSRPYAGMSAGTTAFSRRVEGTGAVLRASIAPLFAALISSTTVLAQSTIVLGRVRDETGRALPGVLVSLRGDSALARLKPTIRGHVASTGGPGRGFDADHGRWYNSRVVLPRGL
jgi:hypothetical protein